MLAFLHCSNNNRVKKSFGGPHYSNHDYLRPSSGLQAGWRRRGASVHRHWVEATLISMIKILIGIKQCQWTRERFPDRIFFARTTATPCVQNCTWIAQVFAELSRYSCMTNVTRFLKVNTEVHHQHCEGSDDKLAWLRSLRAHNPHLKIASCSLVGWHHGGVRITPYII